MTRDHEAKKTRKEAEDALQAAEGFLKSFETPLAGPFDPDERDAVTQAIAVLKETLASEADSQVILRSIAALDAVFAQIADRRLKRVKDKLSTLKNQT